MMCDGSSGVYLIRISGADTLYLFVLELMRHRSMTYSMMLKSLVAKDGLQKLMSLQIVRFTLGSLPYSTSTGVLQAKRKHRVQLRILRLAPKELVIQLCYCRRLARNISPRIWGCRGR